MAILDNGTYRFNDTINFQAQVIQAFVNFICDEELFPSITFDDNNEQIEYGATIVYTTQDGWLDEKYKTIKVVEDTDLNAMFVTLVQLNSTFNFTITYNSNGGTSVSPQIQVDTISYLPQITKSGYSFVGWYLDSDFTTLAIIDTPITSDITLYAKWQELYDIIFNSDGGTYFTPIIDVLSITSLPLPIKDGFNFIGWYYTPNFDIQAQVGDVLNNNVTLYAKWEFVGSLFLRLFNNTSENNRVDKTDYLTNATKIDMYILKPSSIVNPIIELEYNNIFNFNYCYIPKFNRYYFISDVTSLRNNLWQITLKCDVLMSFKNQILGNSAMISRQEYNNNPYLVDEKIPCNANPIIDVIDIATENGIKSTNLGMEVYTIEIGGTTRNV